ncbi:MAG: hypothetical protein JO227_17360 [Acetobacteraceae bacterium]|nr:hypothetical protein [Acetobacteraceae bacterium]
MPLRLPTSQPTFCARKTKVRLHGRRRETQREAVRHEWLRSARRRRADMLAAQIVTPHHAAERVRLAAHQDTPPEHVVRFQG